MRRNGSLPIYRRNREKKKGLFNAEYVPKAGFACLEGPSHT
jgi:hypothetical protein